MKNLFFTEHSGFKFPLDLEPDDYVMYRTTNDTVSKSHLHLPVKAKDLNWRKTVSVGRILEYAVVTLNELGRDTLNYLPMQLEPEELNSAS